MSGADPTPRSESKLNVLMLADYFPRASSGGVERAVLEVSRHLVADGHGVTVLALRTDDSPERETLQGVEVVRVPGLDLSRRLGAQVAVSPQAWTAIRRQIRQQRYDLVHTHTLYFHVSLAASVLAPRERLPLITTAHLGSPDDLGGFVGRATSMYERTLGRRILNASDRVIAVSRAVAEHLRPLVRRPEAIEVIPNGVDLERFRPDPVARAREPATVLFVGRLIFNKGPQFLLDAVPSVLARFPGTRFRFIGDGPMREELEARVRRQGLESAVEFLGLRGEVAELLRQGSMLVRPSLSEGLPLVALEGMAGGLPVVAANVGGTAEVVADGVTGYVLEPESMSLLADRICRLLADGPLRAKMGDAGRAAVEQGYDWSDVAARTLRVYEDVVGRGAS